MNGTSRRDFLQSASAALALGPLGRTGMLASRDRIERIGIQLYTVRQAFRQDPEGTLSRLAAIGYQEVEFVGYPPGTPRDLRAMLDRHRLAAPAAHVPLEALRTDWVATLDRSATIGHRYLVVAFVAATERRSVDDWKRIAALFNQAGEAARKAGIRFCYHNHDFEFVPLDGVVPYDLLLAETDPRYVELEMDLYWTTRGDRDPLDYFARWPGRFPLVHVKDMDRTPERGFADLGAGRIDFARIFRRARQAGIRHYFYEQDRTPGDPFASAEVGYRYLRNLSF